MSFRVKLIQQQVLDEGGFSSQPIAFGLGIGQVTGAETARCSSKSPGSSTLLTPGSRPAPIDSLMKHLEVGGSTAEPSYFPQLSGLLNVENEHQITVRQLLASSSVSLIFALPSYISLN